MVTPSKILGDRGEDEAVKYLKKRNWLVVARNWRCKFGELDIVAAQTKGFLKSKVKELYFVEVKSGLADGEITPELHFHFYKKQRMRRAINSFLSQDNDKITEDVCLRAGVLVVLFDKNSVLREIKEYSVIFD